MKRAESQFTHRCHHYPMLHIYKNAIADGCTRGNKKAVGQRDREIEEGEGES